MVPTTTKWASLASVSKAGPSPETSQRKRPPVDLVTLLSHNRLDVDCDIYVNNNNGWWFRSWNGSEQAIFIDHCQPVSGVRRPPPWWPLIALDVGPTHCRCCLGLFITAAWRSFRVIMTAALRHYCRLEALQPSADWLLTCSSASIGSCFLPVYATRPTLPGCVIYHFTLQFIAILLMADSFLQDSWILS